LPFDPSTATRMHSPYGAVAGESFHSASFIHSEGLRPAQGGRAAVKLALPT
jgi:hypothetical protein